MEQGTLRRTTMDRRETYGNTLRREAIMRHGISTDCQLDHQPAVASSSELSLRKVLPTARFFAAEDIQFCELAESVDCCKAGELVVYRIGQDDPLQLVADALARGAIGILTEQLLPCPLPQCIVGDTEVALARIASAQLQRPDRKLLTIGVIGSAGKTTTAVLVGSLLRSVGYRAAYQTDLGDCDGIIQNTSNKQVPNHSSLIGWLDEVVDNGSQAAVIELSDDHARQGGYDAIEFDILIIAGGANCRTDFGPSAVHCALDCLAEQGVVIAPSEDALTLSQIRESGRKSLTYSVRKAADLTAKIIDQADGVTTLMVHHRDTTAMMETALCGAANAANHLAAALVGLALGQPIEQIVEHLGRLREIPGRGQRLSDCANATVVIDACGTPDRAEQSLRTYRSMRAGGRLWCVLAIDNNDSPDQLARYGAVVEKFADQAILTARLGAGEAFLSASHSILDGVQKCAAMRLVASRRRAIQWAVSQAQPSDTILVITGENSETAHGRRTEIEQLLDWVRQARSDKSTVETSLQLKVFK